MLAGLSSIITRCLDCVLSPRCWLCDAAADGVNDLCRTCNRELPWLTSQVCPRCAMPVPGGGPCGECIRRPWLIERTRAALRYEGDARQLVHGYKFGKDLVAGRVLGQALLKVVTTHYQDEILVPVPSTLQRLRQRGFDPAHEIARFLHRELPGTALLPALARRDSGLPQSRVPTRVGRRSNVQNVFHVKPLPAGPLTLVDDVLTTGATANAAARSLLDAGATAVSLWVCVRTP